MTKNSQTPTQIWDLPIRIIHWGMVVHFALLWWTAENHQWDWHRYSGYSLFALLVFRFYWGIAGSNTAKFSQFLRGPKQTWTYATHILKADKTPVFGHNPLGAWSSVLLLSLLLVQVILGLFAVDVDGWEAGPLNAYISFETGRLCAQWHETIFNLLLGFIGLHIIAIFYYLLWLKHNLIKPMVTGKTPFNHTKPFIAAKKRHYLFALLLAILSIWFFLSLS